MNEVTRILASTDRCDRRTAEQLLPLVYDELRDLAVRRLARERPGQTLQATALVNEAYLRLVGPDDQERCWDGRAHFFAAAAEAMRRILVENARRKGRIRHGGGRQREFVEIAGLDLDRPAQEILALHEALEEFEAHDPVKAKLVELRFFGGMTLKEAADYLGISLSTADRAWKYARAWLYAAMASADSAGA
ncbi:MAG: ECF-type sigma factor [Isosphaeraceae bacterium]